jgi:hypothetical protein
MQQRDFHQGSVLCHWPRPVVVRGVPQLERFAGRLSCGNGDFENVADVHRAAEKINDVPAQGLPKNLLHKKQRLAIDLVLIPYHELPAYDESEIDHSQPKSGTSHFHAYATCRVIRN